MFIGSYYHTIEEKGRISVPKSFRPELSHGSVITRGLDGCLFVFTGDSWSLLLDKLNSLPFTGKSARDFLRLLTYNAAPVELDKLGRTRIPDNLMQLAGLSKEVVFAGALSRVEVWDKKKYHAYVDSLEGKEPEIETALAELGI
ncbi:MAG: Protein MraZ [Microgenomates group bacterium GW2011_GWF2_47_9]|nr:MAG: Protein MraZ [Microgenomates group bacterium GW2011_GWF2_47_9]